MNLPAFRAKNVARSLNDEVEVQSKSTAIYKGIMEFKPERSRINLAEIFECSLISFKLSIPCTSRDRRCLAHVSAAGA